MGCITFHPSYEFFQIVTINFVQRNLPGYLIQYL
jgi:hypothetical protein